MGKDGWIYGVKAIADFVGVGCRTVERWIETDETDFPVSKVGGRWTAHPDDLRRWMNRERRATA